MAVDDLWMRADGTPSKRHGRGLRYRVRVQGYRATSHRTRKEAERVNALRISAGPPRPEAEVLVADLLDQLMSSKSGLSKGGYNSLKAGADHARLRWGHLRPGDIQPWQIEEWLAGLQVATGRSDGSMRPASAESKIKALQALKGGLHIAERMGAIGRNPAADITIKRRNVRDPRFLRIEQLTRLGDCAGQRWRTMILLMGTAGPRIGETCAFNVEDVDLQRGRLRVRASKSGRPRDVPVPRSVLDELALDGREPDEPLFLSERGCRVLVDHWRNRVFVPAAEKASLSGIVPHDLRHTAASLMIASGASVKEVQAALGHSSARTTLDLYAGLFDDRLDDVAARMNRMLG